MGAQQWFVCGDEGEQGPLNSNQLREWARTGRLTWGSRLRLEGSDRVIHGRDIAGLLPAESVALPDLTPPGSVSGVSSAAPVALPDITLPAPATTPEPLPSSGLPALPPVTSTSSFDPGAKPEALFENYEAKPAGGTSAVRRSASLAPRPIDPATRTLAKPGTATVTRTIGARLIEKTLDQPRWPNLWPLVVLTLVLGWIVGGFFSFERMYGVGDSFPVFVLALGAVPMACAAMLHYLRPRQVPVGAAIGVALFTAIVGIVMLLILQSLAEMAANTRTYGRGGALMGVLKIIGVLYQLIYSDNVVQRWIGFVFGVGLCEEMIKLLPLVMMVIWRSDRHLSVHGFLFLGFASGLGFGIGEAYYGYAPWNGNYGLDANIIRWYSAVPSHAIYTTVCAAFLWKMGDQLEHAEGFWERGMVVAMAAGLMAVVHGTYNTVCSIGIIPALFMEVVSFVLLVLAVRWVSQDAIEPKGTTATPWMQRLFPARNLAIGTVFAAVLLLGAGALSSHRDDVMPDILRKEVPKEYLPYVDGVTLDLDHQGQPFPVPLQVRFVIDVDNGIVADIRNLGGEAFTAVTVDIINAEGGSGHIELGELAAGAETRIDLKRGWTLQPGEHLVFAVDGHPSFRVRMPVGTSR